MNLYEKNDISQHTFIDRLTGGSFPMSIDAAKALFTYAEITYEDLDVQVDFDKVKVLWNEVDKEEFEKDMQLEGMPQSEHERQMYVDILKTQNDTLLYCYIDTGNGFHVEQ